MTARYGIFTQNAAPGADTYTLVDDAHPLPVTLVGAATGAKQDTGNTSLASLDGKAPALGQALASASVPVVLTAAQVTTLTPPTTVAVTQATGTNLHAVVDSGTITTVSAVTAITNALPAGSAIIGKVGIDQTTPGTTNHVESSTNARRNTGVLHRNAVTAVDKLAAPAQATSGTDIGTGGSLTFNTAYLFTAAAYNRWGATTVPATATVTTANDAANTHCVRFTLAQVTGADGYDIFMSTSTNPLWVGRITESQRAAGGCRITAVGTVDASGAGGAGTVQVNVAGTGLASNVNPFLTSNAYTPATPTAINCAGYSRTRLHVKLAVTDLRSLPTLTLVPFFADQTSGTDYFAGAALALSLLNAAGTCLEQDYSLDVDGATGLVVLVDSISGQGAAASIWVELS